MTNLIDDRSEIVFFDVETTMPTYPGQACALLEFGAILVCPRTLAVLESYTTLIRPEDPSIINSWPDRRNGISRDGVASAPSFRDVADRVYDILHGRVWAGHNILEFDWLRIKEAFEEVGRAAPEPKGAIDSLAILKQKFGRRAGDMKMASLAIHFGLGEQTHRSLDDVRMNLEVVKRCATVLFLEDNVMGSSEMLRQSGVFEGCSDGSGFVDPDEVSIPSISVALRRFSWRTPRLRILHKNAVLQIWCPRLRVRFGIDAKFSDHAGRPRFNFVVDASASLCRVLDACEDAAFNRSENSGSDSKWRPVVIRKNGYLNSPTVRLDLPTAVNGENATSGAEIYHQDSSGATQKLTFTASNAGEHEFGTLLIPGTAVDAYISLKPYNYKQKAGIKPVFLVCENCIFDSEALSMTDSDTLVTDEVNLLDKDSAAKIELMAGYASSEYCDSCDDDNMTEFCSNVRILLWDSSGQGCGGLPALLQSCSYEVRHVSSPGELLASLETEARCIDFILINFHNHVDRSMDVLKYLTRRCDIPVIVLLEASQVPLLGKCLPMGASDYLVKPLHTEELSTLWKRSAVF